MAVAARYGVPVVNARGVACDGAHVWLMAGDHNAPTHTLSYVELASSAVSKSYAYDNLIENLGTGVYGITQLAGTVFISVAGNTNKIVHVDAATGKIIGQFAAPTDLGPSDLDLSGGDLIESSGTGTVFKLDTRTGAVLGRFSAGNFGRDQGVAVRDQEAFVGSLFGGLDVYDLTTGSPKGHVTKLDGSEFEEDWDVGPMCFNGSKLLVLSRLGLTEYEVRAPAP
jgi:outer membrane protein assembly factor BamB